MMHHHHFSSSVGGVAAAAIGDAAIAINLIIAEIRGGGVMNGKRSRRKKLQQIRRGSTKYKHIQIGKPLLIFVVLNNE